VYFGRALPLRDDPALTSKLAEHVEASPEGRRALTARIANEQHYQLAHWQTANRRLGYRRFFDITDLAGVRVEDEVVFQASHALVLELVASGDVTGLRVDHVDGLREPTAYLQRLRAQSRAYTLVEKILAREEPLAEWPVAGTTGYDFLNLLNGLFIDPAGFDRIAQGYRGMTGDGRDFADIVHEKKHLVMRTLFGGELARLQVDLARILEGRYPDDQVTTGIAEITAAMPVYRTYTEGFDVSRQDRAALADAFRAARRRAPDLSPALLQELEQVLHVASSLGDRRAAALEFVLKWQQFSGPVMAKGFEDTALYTWTPLLSANEVGSMPAAPALEVAEFHARMSERAATWPHAQSATATHDTKRGEDVRARLNAVTEIPDEWLLKFRAWVRRSVDHKEDAAVASGLPEDAAVANAKEENLLYQTLVGAWPLSDGDDDFMERVKAYMTKALREAKESTSWHGPDEDYESALSSFVERLLSFPRLSLRKEMESFATRISWHGALTSLSQTLIKMTAPGVPDFYQGTELWSLVLVDPDNRQPVDYGLRASRLADLESLLSTPQPAGAAALLGEWRDGSVKLFTTAAALRFRRRHSDLFENGQYVPVEARGERADHIVAFARRRGADVALTVAPRLYTSLCAPGMIPGREWGDTLLVLPGDVAGRSLTDVFTGRRCAASPTMSVAALLEAFPIGLLSAD
jgi:(1->4)-alpha-D-glucan 1-alpha-D-glucosylmutase